MGHMLASLRICVGLPEKLMLASALRLTNYVARHPLNRGRVGHALLRLLAWQIGSRLVPGDVAVPYVNGTRLLVRHGQTGATGNIYCGLHDYEDMAVTLHLLRPGDLFVDVGANIGSYTVLAAGAARARCISIEPCPIAFARLRDHVLLNDLVQQVTLHRVAVGEATGAVRFTSGLDTVNHVLGHGEDPDAIAVPMRRLDDILADDPPTLIKIDVEGYEARVLGGAETTLRRPSLLAVLVELNGSAYRYGGTDDAVRSHLQDAGFVSARYDVPNRTLHVTTSKSEVGNTLYVRAGRAFDVVTERLRGAQQFEVAGRRV